MRTLILAYVIALLGAAMIGGGIWGFFYLTGQARPIPLRYYGMAIGMTCGGFAMLGVAQALRVLLRLLAGVQGLH
jgi:hypothetical protein